MLLYLETRRCAHTTTTSLSLLSARLIDGRPVRSVTHHALCMIPARFAKARHVKCFLLDRWTPDKSIRLWLSWLSSCCLIVGLFHHGFPVIFHKILSSLVTTFQNIVDHPVMLLLSLFVNKLFDCFFNSPVESVPRVFLCPIIWCTSYPLFRHDSVQWHANEQNRHQLFIARVWLLPKDKFHLFAVSYHNGINKWSRQINVYVFILSFVSGRINKWNEWHSSAFDTFSFNSTHKFLITFSVSSSFPGISDHLLFHIQSSSISRVSTHSGSPSGSQITISLIFILHPCLTYRGNRDHSLSPFVLQVHNLYTFR